MFCLCARATCERASVACDSWLEINHLSYRNQSLPFPVPETNQEVNLVRYNAMSNIQASLQVADRIASRLFDHRQFTAGQIDYFVKGIESIASPEGNLNKILKTNENGCVIGDVGIHDNKFNDEPPRAASSGISSLIDKAERVLEIEAEYKEKQHDIIDQIKADREKVKQDKIRRVNRELDKIRRSLEEEEQELERKYRKLEEVLAKK